MTSERLGDMFEGDSAHMCAGKFSLMLMGGRAKGLVCADPGARTPIGMSETFIAYCAHSNNKSHKKKYPKWKKKKFNN